VSTSIDALSSPCLFATYILSLDFLSPFLATFSKHFFDYNLYFQTLTSSPYTFFTSDIQESLRRIPWTVSKAQLLKWIASL